LDRVVGNAFPSLATAADVKIFEAVPYIERIAAASTFDAIKLGAAHKPDAPAIKFLPNASPG
jgi:fatty-acyl-CoA synthase